MKMHRIGVTLITVVLFLSGCAGATTMPRTSTSSNPTPTTRSTSSQSNNNPPAPGGYLASGSNYVLFIQFASSGNSFSGQWFEAIVTNDNPPKVNTFDSSMYGNVNGTNLTINANYHSYIGSFDGTNVTIEFPQQDGTISAISLHPASIDDYNNAVTALESNVSQQAQQQATATALADEQNRLAYDVSNIHGVIQQLASDSDFSSVLKSYSNEIDQMQSDYKKEQADASAGCNNASQVSYDDSVVSYDSSVISYDDSVLSNQDNSVSHDIANVQDWINAIQKHWNDLGQQSPNMSASDVHTTLKNGNNAISQAQSSQNNAKSQATGYDNSAKQIQQQADALSNNMKC